MKHSIDWFDFGLDKINSAISLLIQIDLGKAEATVSIIPGMLVDSA